MLKTHEMLENVQTLVFKNSNNSNCSIVLVSWWNIVSHVISGSGHMVRFVVKHMGARLIKTFVKIYSLNLINLITNSFLKWNV